MDIDKIRNVLNIIFLVLAVAAVILYFTASFKVFMYTCAAAIFFKGVEFLIRFTNR